MRGDATAGNAMLALPREWDRRPPRNTRRQAPTVCRVSLANRRGCGRGPARRPGPPKARGRRWRWASGAAGADVSCLLVSIAQSTGWQQAR
jgi:hypothetical protein